MFHSAHGKLLHENFFDMRPEFIDFNGIMLPDELHVYPNKEIEIIIKTNSIVGDTAISGINTEDEYFEGDFESKYKNYLKFVLNGPIIVSVFLYNPNTDQWIDFSGPLYSKDMYVNKMFSLPNIEYDYIESDWKTGFLGLVKTRDGYEKLGNWSNPGRKDVRLYNIKNQINFGLEVNEDQFVYLFNHILGNHILARKLLNPEPLKITIFNSACLYFGVNIKIAGELFPTWTDIWKHEIETVLLDQMKTTKNEIKELNKLYPDTVKMFNDSLKSFRKTYKGLSKKWGEDNDLGDLYDLVQEEKGKREKKYNVIFEGSIPKKFAQSYIKSVKFMDELEDDLNELMILDTEKEELKDNLESKIQESVKYKSMKTEYDLLKNLNFPVTFEAKRNRKKPNRLKPVFPVRSISKRNRKGKSSRTKKQSRGKKGLSTIVDSV